MPEVFDVVELVVDLPRQGLYVGMQGTIVEIHQAGAAYEVEFTDEQGQALNWLALSPEQFVVVREARSQQWVPLAQRVADLVARLPEAAGGEVLEFARFLSVRTTRTGESRPPTPPAPENVHG
ncbi:MAG: DUF4926 domain-containing protein [Candidatus Entotheonellia bacterium]